MSGGSYDYFYTKLEDMADSIRVPGGCVWEEPNRAALREAFKAHLRACAEACRAIEWNDSGDGDSREAELIRKCIAPDATLRQAISNAREAQAALAAELALATGEAGGE